jgi:hypothetical protein
MVPGSGGRYNRGPGQLETLPVGSCQRGGTMIASTTPSDVSMLRCCTTLRSRPRPVRAPGPTTGPSADAPCMLGDGGLGCAARDGNRRADVDVGLRSAVTAEDTEYCTVQEEDAGRK